MSKQTCDVVIRGGFRCGQFAEYELIEDYLSEGDAHFFCKKHKDKFIRQLEREKLEYILIYRPKGFNE